MKSLVRSYERYLKNEASVPPSQLLNAVYKVTLPWALPGMAGLLLAGILRLPRDLGVWLVVPTACVAMVGVIYAGSRIVTYGWQFARTPRDLALRQTSGSDALVQALRRVTLNGLSDLTPSTRLQADLMLTPSDVSALLGILAAENWLDDESLDGMTSGDLTVEALLRKMARA